MKSAKLKKKKQDFCGCYKPKVKNINFLDKIVLGANKFLESPFKK